MADTAYDLYQGLVADDREERRLGMRWTIAGEDVDGQTADRLYGEEHRPTAFRRKDGQGWDPGCECSCETREGCRHRCTVEQAFPIAYDSREEAEHASANWHHENEHGPADENLGYPGSGWARSA